MKNSDARKLQAHRAILEDERQYRDWYNSPDGKRRYLQKAYANGRQTFDPAKYELATQTSPDLDNLKSQALAGVRAMFNQETNMNEQELNILMRIANALEAIAQASAPAAPNYQFPFEEYPTFDWSRINAMVVSRDEYGATAVNWSGHAWKRRSWPQKYGLVIGFTRPDGMGEDGVNWLTLISFKEMRAVEPLDSKVTRALTSQRQNNGNGRKQPEPGTWGHVEAGGASNSKVADLRGKLQENDKPTLGTVASLVALTNLYTTANHAMQALQGYDFPPGVTVAKGQKVSRAGALKVFDWLVDRKLDEEE